MKILAGMTHAHDFSKSPQANIPRSAFSRSHGHKTTFNAGYLIPVLIDEALPGDTFNLKMTAFARMATPIFPIMDNLYLDSFFFFIPNRLLWDHWEEFNGFQRDPDDTTDYVLPTITSTAVTGYDEDTIFDYMGLPTKVPGVVTNSLPLRAYNLVWNEWFRDQNMQDSVVTNRDDGPDAPADYALKKRGKRYDYFTSSLPFPQKGPDVEVPLGLTAPVVLADTTPTAAIVRDYSTHAAITNLNPVRTGPGGAFSSGVGDPVPAYVIDPNGTLFADLSDATAATINQLRQSFAIQRMYERDARGGTRYTEIIRSHFGVISPDARLQRPEYLGGGTTVINIHPVAQTSATTDTETPQGNLSAFATVSAINHGFTKSFVEHGVILGLVSVRADYTYQQGTNRLWYRSTRFDYYWPALSHLGEQAVLNREIFTQGSDNPSVDLGVFGYQGAYDEYRYKPSMVTGKFRSNATDSLDSWHLAQDFAALPVLNSEFIEENPPMARVKAVETEPDFIFDSYFDYRCARPMPTYAVPGLIDHF